MTEFIGFIGLGRMGSAMATRLIQSGLKVYVFDANEAAIASMVEQGAIAASSLADLASKASVVFTSLPNAAIVKEVLFGENGVVYGSNSIRHVVDLSTIGTAAAKEISGLLREQGIGWVEAPISGGPKGAKEGTLAVIVSGEKADIDHCTPYLANFGRVIEVGYEAGLAQTAKLANNMLSSAAVIITSEVMAMGAKAGLDPDILLEVINAGSGRNTATADKFPRAVLTGGFDYGFATGLAYKDIRLCVDESETLGVPMLMGSVVRQMLAATNAQYGSNSDLTEVAKIYEGWADVEIRSKKGKE